MFLLFKNLVINVCHKSVLFGPNIKWYNKIELSVSSRHFFLGNNFYWVFRINIKLVATQPVMGHTIGKAVTITHEPFSKKPPNHLPP